MGCSELSYDKHPRPQYRSQLVLVPVLLDEDVLLEDDVPGDVPGDVVDGIVDDVADGVLVEVGLVEQNESQHLVEQHGHMHMHHALLQEE